MFRVTAAQLESREGQVRCGHCRAVFDANAELVSLDAAPPPDPLDVSAAPPVHSPAPEEASDATKGVQAADRGFEERAGESGAVQAAADMGTTVEGTAVEGTALEGTAVEGTAVEAVADTGTAVEGTAIEDDADEAHADGSGADVQDVSSPFDAVAETASPTLAPSDFAQRSPAGRFEWKKKRATGHPSTRMYAGAAGLLLVGLLLQAVFEYRDALAAHLPASRPLLNAACGLFGCAIEPLRDAGALSIDASDLQADPSHRGLLLLSATLRNRSTHAIAFPYLELTLTDASDRIVARRAFPPAEYAGSAAEPLGGIPANGEHVVRLFLDASATQQAGYRLYLFYP